MAVWSILRGVLGMILVLGIAVAFSSNRRRISWRLVGTGLLLQAVLAVFVIHGKTMGSWFAPLAWPKLLVDWAGGAVVTLLGFITEGSRFVFGSLAVSAGDDSLGFFFAFQVLPTIIFFASLTAVLYHLGILQAVVRVMASVMSRLMGTSGAESLSNSANVFIGQTEAPILVRPYITHMTRSELLTIMVGGMATVAGGVMASYIQLLGRALAEAQGVPIAQAQLTFAVHLITASVMAAPASLVIAKILVPETGEPRTRGQVTLRVERESANLLDAASSGAADGLKLALNVGAMLIVFIAFVYMFNYILASLGDLIQVNAWLKSEFGAPLSLELLLGFLLKYIAIGIGVPAADAMAFGSLFGTKVVLNEFVAYVNLVDLIKQGLLSEKSVIMATYALCGFANFSSIGIQIGGIGPMAPTRKAEIAALGLRAVLGGSLVTLLTASLAGILI
ncbi:MAG: nucleoside transporter C-terminal domain-containing protein [Acidobacteriota bacterium]|jgi:CNT family concentrative nucleoside transporter|nr:nucleoside transporter C-terminal domain-containing protein [Acidobacteriota bacterium]